MIIDFHTHVFPDKIAARTIAALSATGRIPAHSDGTLDGLRGQMSLAGIDVAVNLPVLTSPHQFESVNRYAREINESFEGRGVLSFAGVHPDMENVCEEIRNLRKEGFLGIKIHPDYQGHFIDDDEYYLILKTAKEEGLITVTHAGVDGAYRDRPVRCTPERAKRMLCRLGGYSRLVLAHLGGNEMHSEVYSTLAGEDVYFDTSYILEDIEDELFLRIVERHGEDRILFATDSPWQNEVREVARLSRMPLGVSAKEKILFENARGLLNLK